MTTSRRVFLMACAASGTVLSTTAQAQLVDPKDANAVALGYYADTTKVDKKKWAKHAAEQKCGNCALYQGAAASEGGCPLFAGKKVLAAGWCSAYAKKG